jgi:hypothetical protein
MGARLEELSERLRPDVNRAKVLAEFDQMFSSGSTPDPHPNGFLPGRLLTTSVWGPADALVRRVARYWMPWQGKTFDPSSMIGRNRFRTAARTPMRAVWPSYAPLSGDAERIEAFEFRTRIAPGALDPQIQVLKIDYDFELNPKFIIRSILDELVQVADGVYLGKVLLRWRGAFRPAGFFSLRQADGSTGSPTRTVPGTSTSA